MRKKIYTSFVILCSAGSIYAQSVSETVSIGAGYANHIWYGLESGTSTSAAKNTWDIAFATSAIGFGSSIRVNAITGTHLWLYPHGDTSAWTSLDTAGLHSWKESYNSDTSWMSGAFDAYVNPADEFDLGWGVYNMMTHFVVGDSLFVIKLSDNSYRKLWIQSLASGAYHFKFAKLDGTDETTHTLLKSDYSGKNFGYYALRTNTETNPEPVNTQWDLLFTQYSTLIPGFGPYNVSGVLQNNGTKAVKVYPVDDPDTYSDFWSQPFSTEYNQIGYDWKTFTGSAYEVSDSTVYFVQTGSGDIWRLVFTGFGGSADGNFYFDKEKISSNGIAEHTAETFMSVYPNPCSQEQLSVITDVTSPNSRVELWNMYGQMAFSQHISGSGLSRINVPVVSLETGTYMLRLVNGHQTVTKKVVIQSHNH